MVRRWLVLVLCLTCAGTMPVHAQRARANGAAKRVLVLYWYNRNYPINVGIEQGFLAELRSAGSGQVEYFAEFLESDRFPGDHQARLLHDYLQQKYADMPVDVVVASGVATHEFLVRHRQTLFSDAALVFLSIPSASDTARRRGVTGIVSYAQYRKRIELARRLHPETNQVYLISGTLTRDLRYEATARAELAADPGVEVIYLTDLPVEELVRRVQSLPPRSVILFAWQQVAGEEGTVLESADVLRAIVAVASVPVHVMSEQNVGGGAVGGEVLTLEGNGKRAAQVALRILGGTKPEDIPVEGAPTVPMFDWRQVQRWKIPEDRLPPGSIVQFRQLTVWDQYRWYIVAAVTFVAVQGALIVALLFQRASRRRAELKAQQQQREVTHLSRVATVGELTGTLAHEMRQPLAAILANAQAAQRLLGHDDVDRGELRNALSDIIHSDRLAGEVINRIREALRRNDGSMEFVDMNQVVNDTVSLLQTEFTARSTSLATVLAPDLPTVRGNRVELQQVLLNLFLNACDAMGSVPANRRLLTVRTEVTPDQEVLVSVTDQGPGIRTDTIDSIFTPFFTTKQHGLGLGLAICHRIITAHGGRIWAENTDGGGATIAFCLPARSPAAVPDDRAP